MNRSLAIAFLGFALIVAGMVTADASGPRSGFKVGFVDLERTLVETPAGKRASQEFEKTRKQKQKELDRKQQELQQYATELEKQRTVLKPEVLKQRQEELQKRYLEVQELYVKLERDLAAERTKLIQEILKKAGPVIQDIAKKEGFAMIVDRNAVLWSDDALDLTAQINARIK
jgi:outer membrane protein